MLSNCHRLVICSKGNKYNLPVGCMLRGAWIPRKFIGIRNKVLTTDTRHCWVNNALDMCFIDIQGGTFRTIDSICSQTHIKEISNKQDSTTPQVIDTPMVRAFEEFLSKTYFPVLLWAQCLLHNARWFVLRLCHLRRTHGMDWEVQLERRRDFGASGKYIPLDISAFLPGLRDNAQRILRR